MKRILKYTVLASVLLAAGNSYAGGAVILSGKSQTGKAQLFIKRNGMEGEVTRAYVVIEKDTTAYEVDCDAYIISDIPNHLYTAFFRQKGAPMEDENAKVLKVWAIPSSFVQKASASADAWRFKARFAIGSKSNAKTLPDLIDCNFEVQP